MEGARGCSGPSLRAYGASGPPLRARLRTRPSTLMHPCVVSVFLCGERGLFQRPVSAAQCGPLLASHYQHASPARPHWPAAARALANSQAHECRHRHHPAGFPGFCPRPSGFYPSVLTRARSVPAPGTVLFPVPIAGHGSSSGTPPVRRANVAPSRAQGWDAPDKAWSRFGARGRVMRGVRVARPRACQARRGRSLFYWY